MQNEAYFMQSELFTAAIVNHLYDSISEDPELS